MTTHLKVLLCLLNSVFALTTFEERMKDRMEPVLGVTYFGSEQLLNTEIETVKPFIADFTLPKKALNVTSSQTIDVVTFRVSLPEQKQKASDSGGTYLKHSCRELVVHYHPDFDRRDFLPTFLIVFEDSTPNCIEMIQELWIFIHDDAIISTATFFARLVFKITQVQFKSLRKLHMISMMEQRSLSSVILPFDFEHVSNQLHMIHLRKVRIEIMRNVDVKSALYDPTNSTLSQFFIFGSPSQNGSQSNKPLRIVSLQKTQKIMSHKVKSLETTGNLSFAYRDEMESTCKIFEVESPLLSCFSCYICGGLAFN